LDDVAAAPRHHVSDVGIVCEVVGLHMAKPCAAYGATGGSRPSERRGSLARPGRASFDLGREACQAADLEAGLGVVEADDLGEADLAADRDAFDASWPVGAGASWAFEDSWNPSGN
jgi:hypothetical protein